MKYFGPFKIIERIGAVAYKLELPGSARINLVFHVSLLKKFRGDSTNPYMPLPLQTETESPILQPFQVLASRTIIQGSILTPQIWCNGRILSLLMQLGRMYFRKHMDKVIFDRG